MGNIRILPEQVVNQIAAGEVVDRAASALKELIENALDAGATRIQVVLSGHGRELIQVVDDGGGMSHDDLHLAFERHATSKLKQSDDLWAIRTLGFRGEALPSIASVSFVEARSRARESASGTLLRIQGGDIILDEPAAMPIGTSLAVHSLFYNTPARASFLKSPATELAHLIRVFRQYAVAYPEIAWSFTHDTAVEYTLPAGDFESRLNDLFGTGFASKVLWLKFEQAGIRVSGAVGLPELFRKSRGDQYTFLNRRPIQSAMLHSAVKAALREQLDPMEWPFYVLLIELDPTLVDVNVHPAKSEVKFADEKLIHAAVYRAVRDVQPRQFDGLAAEVQATAAADAWISQLRPPSASTIPDLFTAAPARPGITSPADPRFPAAPEPPPDTESPAAGEPSEEPPVPLLKPAIFQVHQKYLISQIRSGLVILDQHAAHERILYERALRSFTQRTFQSQQLLFPVLLELNPDDDALFNEFRADLGELGFEIRDFGARTYSIEAVPSGLRRASESAMIPEIVEEYREFRRANFTARDALAASFACKAAIRTGDALTADEMSALVDELFATQFPLTCPHGRPTVIHLKLSELDRRFKRTE
ncbi:DNA mismatch repair endonuclease MutL [candidate division KSB1 bacterium]|nr:DNA mismatch repair endonuclease MutL [candidate division KSB1 bacterium]